MAYAVGREGDIIRRAVCVLTNGGIGKQIGVPVVVDESRVTKTIDKVAKAVNRPHKNASLKTVGGRLEIVDDSCGIKLDEKRAVDSVVGALKSNQLVVQLPVEADRPDVTADDLREIDTLLARFSTRFNPGKRDRTHNLVLAARSMDGIVVKPGREFSYNDTVGPRVLTRGFREAPIFVRGKMEPGVGGGICQVSSTLYNAVLLAGLKVVERAPHSRTVPYVSAGRDATVAYGLRDFRFENVGSAAVGILTHINGSQLTVDIYGSARDKKNISVFTGPVAYHGGAGEKTVIDTGLAPGARKVIDKGSKGASVTVYRKVTDSDGKVVTEVVSRDRYPKQDTIVAVGPKIQPVQAELSVTPASVAGAGGNDVRAE
jgi:vancomycin resistance protein VanW